MENLIYVVLMLLVTAFLALRLSMRERKRPILAMPSAAKGFGARDEKVTITLGDGTEVETTFGEIEQKVREINGVSFWVEKKRDIYIAAATCLIGCGFTLGVFLYQEGLLWPDDVTVEKPPVSSSPKPTKPAESTAQ